MSKLVNGWDAAILAVALIAAVLSAWALYARPDSQAGGYASVSVRGEIIAVLPLNTDVDGYVIETPEGINRLTISSQAAQISYADCPDRLCVRQGAVGKGGEFIVCLPHGVVIEITGLPTDIDGTTR